MDKDKKALLRQKLSENGSKMKQAEAEKERQRIIQTVDGFSDRYRFADEAETERIADFIGKLHFSFPAHIECDDDTSVIPEMRENNAYLVFLCGTRETTELYVYGKCSDILENADDWEIFSPYILLIDEGFEKYIFINDSGKMTGSRIGQS